MSLTGKTLAQMWPNWCHQLCRKNSRFHVQKLWPHCHFVKWPPKNRVLFWGWNVKIWWPAHRKTIKPMEMRCKLDKKTWNPLQNAKRHRIHKHQKGNVATFNYPPGGLIYIDLPINDGDFPVRYLSLPGRVYQRVDLVDLDYFLL